MRPMGFVFVLAALLLVPAIAAAASSAPVGRAEEPGAAQVAENVSIVDFTFEPMVVITSVGSTVTWTNTGAVPHTVTSDVATFDSGILNSGGTFSMTFTAPGTYTYHCAIHPSMMAAIQVN